MRKIFLSFGLLLLVHSLAVAQHHFSDAERRIITLVDEGRGGDSIVSYLGNANADVAWRAAVGLANLRDTTSRDALCAALGTEQRDTVANAEAFALGMLGVSSHSLQALLARSASLGSVEVYRAIGRVVPAVAAPEVTKMLLERAMRVRPQLDRQVAVYGVELGLREIYPSSLGTLVDSAAQSIFPDARWRAAYVYTHAKDSSLILHHLATLTGLLQDQGSVEARMFAASSIGRLRSMASTRILEDALRSDPSWQVRVNILNALVHAPRFDSTLLSLYAGVVDAGVTGDAVASNTALAAAQALTQFIIAGKFSKQDSVRVRAWVSEYDGLHQIHNDVDRLVQASLTPLAARLRSPTVRDAIHNFASMSDFELRKFAIDAAALIPDTLYVGSMLASMPLCSPRDQGNRLEALGSLWKISEKDVAFQRQLEQSKLAAIYRYLVLHDPQLITEPEVVVPCFDAWRLPGVLNTDSLRSTALHLLPNYVRLFSGAKYRDQLLAALRTIPSLHGSSPDLVDALHGAVDYAVKGSDEEVLDSLHSVFTALPLPWKGYRVAPRVSTIDWGYLESLKNTVLVNFPRNRFEITLLPYQAPLTVLRMMELLREHYFANQIFHRVVPNFVIQSGDPTGSGWGGPGYQMRTEVAPIAYDVTGMVGMASSGRNTEGSQWFVTEAPTPHLTGHYTIWGEVKRGIDRVNGVMVGDQLETLNPFNR